MSDFNHDLIDELRSNGGQATSGPFVGRQMIILTTTGARSGSRQSTPLVYSRDADRYVIVASMGGAPKHPAWFHNLKADPRVTAEVGGETFEATATITDETERQRLYAQHAELHPSFNDYPKLTERVIPVVVLERTGAAEAAA
jgi:deazaflavin-dependent oxidoreductase (nitroreductase family)